MSEPADEPTEEGTTPDTEGSEVEERVKEVLADEQDRLHGKDDDTDE